MIYTKKAQKAINEIIHSIRTKGDFDAAFNRALETLQKEFDIDRAVLLQVSGDQLTITHEVAKNGEPSFRKSFSAQESTMMVIDMLSRSPDGAKIQVLTLNRDIPEETFLPYLRAFENCSSHLLAEIRGQIFHGFIIMQSIEPRKWTDEERSSLVKISELLAVIFSMWFDQQKLISDYMVLEAQSKIDSMDLNSNEALADIALRGVELIANACHFNNFRLYLLDDQHLLDSAAQEQLNLDDSSNPFVSISKVKRGSVFVPGIQDAPKCFAGTAGMIVPLVQNEKLLGVFAIWNCNRHNGYISPQHREIALTLAGKLADKISTKTS
jgi:GAF domain-containing protein